MSKFINRLNVMFSHVEAEPPLFTTIYEYEGARGEVNYELTYMVGVKKPLRQEEKKFGKGRRLQSLLRSNRKSQQSSQK